MTKEAEEQLNKLRTMADEALKEANSLSWQFTKIDDFFWKRHSKFIPQLKDGISRLEKSGVDILSASTKKWIKKTKLNEVEFWTEVAKLVIKLLECRTNIYTTTDMDFRLFRRICQLAGIDSYFKSLWIYVNLRFEDRHYESEIIYKFHRGLLGNGGR